MLASTARADSAGGSLRVVDESEVPLVTVADRRALEDQLAGFEMEHHIRVLLRLHAHSPSAEHDKIPGAYMRSLSQSMGTASDGVLVVYFADEDDWRIWFGDNVAPRFVGVNMTARELTENGAIHDAKEALLNESRKAGEAAFAKLSRTADASEAELKQKRVLLHADALLERLFVKLARH